MSIILYTLATTHLTIVCVTLYLHRCQAHRSVTFHPVITHAMRFWLWLTTGMVTREWVAIHRRHHQLSDQPGDPHSPHIWGLWQVLFKGAWLYHRASLDSDMIRSLGVGAPDDWIERNVYSAHSRLGIAALLAINLLMFGWLGAVVWAVQMIWIPFWAAGVINGLAHWVGYRNGVTRDQSRNIVPWGVIVGGEELHNNHHLSPGSAKLSLQTWEFDIGWFYIRCLKMLGLCSTKTM